MILVTYIIVHIHVHIIVHIAYLPKHLVDYIDNDAVDNHVPVPVNIYNSDPAMPRNTLEVRNINQNGRPLLEMCKSIPVRILNGRTFGDTIGNFTRYPIYNSQNEPQSLPNVTDYALADPCLFTKIKYFSVSNMTRCFDHCSIKLSLKTNFEASTGNTYCHLSSEPPRFQWSIIHKSKLLETFSSSQCQSLLSEFSNSPFNSSQTGIDNATNQLTDIIVNTTKAVVPLRTSRIRKRAKKKWYDKSCFHLKHELNRLCSRVSKDPLNPLIRRAVVVCRKSYKKLLKTKETTYFVKLKEKLKSSGENNPKKVWEIIKGLCNDQHEPNVNPIDFETWDTYFNKLYQPDFTSRAKLGYPVHEVQNIETDAISSISNRTISVDEMRRAIKKLKNGKSAGEDNVINEVSKTTQPYLELH